MALGPKMNVKMDKNDFTIKAQTVKNKEATVKKKEDIKNKKKP